MLTRYETESDMVIYESKEGSFVFYKDYEQLQAKNDALVARVARLREWVKTDLEILDEYSENDEYMACLKLLNETESESLAAIQADGIEVNLPAKKHVPEDTANPKYALGWNDMIREMRLRAQKLRQQGKDHD